MNYRSGGHIHKHAVSNTLSGGETEQKVMADDWKDGKGRNLIK